MRAAMAASSFAASTSSLSAKELDSVNEEKVYHRRHLAADEGSIPRLATDIQETDATSEIE